MSASHVIGLILGGLCMLATAYFILRGIPRAAWLAARGRKTEGLVVREDVKIGKGRVRLFTPFIEFQDATGARRLFKSRFATLRSQEKQQVQVAYDPANPTFDAEMVSLYLVLEHRAPLLVLFFMSFGAFLSFVLL